MAKGKAGSAKKEEEETEDPKTKKAKPDKKKGKAAVKAEEPEKAAEKPREAVPNTDPKDFDYEFLLTKAREKLPTEQHSDQRWHLPDPDIVYEGKLTIFKNFNDIVSSIRRESDELYAFLLKELGTSGARDPQRVVFKGRIGQKAIFDKVNAFVREFVLCHECKKPDTHFEKDGRITILMCEVCGARRPINIKKALK